MFAIALALAAAPSLHERIIVLDTHLDTPVNLGRPGWSFAEPHRFEDSITQVDLPRMKQGGLDGGFFVIYTEQGPLTPKAMRRRGTMPGAAPLGSARWSRENARKMELATTAADAGGIAQGRQAHRLPVDREQLSAGRDVALLETSTRPACAWRGRCIMATTSSPTPRPRASRAGAASVPLGRRWVAEVNRLGMMIDVSHASDETFDQMLALSTAPVIAVAFRAQGDASTTPATSTTSACSGSRQGRRDLRQLGLPRRMRCQRPNARESARERMETAEPARAARHGCGACRRWSGPGRAIRADVRSLHAEPAACAEAGRAEHVGIGMDWDGGGGLIACRT